jgi:hypothetical protein
MKDWVEVEFLSLCLRIVYLTDASPSNNPASHAMLVSNLSIFRFEKVSHIMFKTFGLYLHPR